MGRSFFALLILATLVGGTVYAQPQQCWYFDGTPSSPTYGTWVFNSSCTKSPNIGWIGARGFSSLNAAVTAAKNSGLELKIFAPIPLTAPLTTVVPISIEGSGLILQTGTNTFPLTINGPFRAAGQAFSGFGAGQVTFMAGRTAFVRPDLWQVNTTPGTTDMSVAVQSAFSSLPATGGRVEIDGIMGVGSTGWPGIAVTGKSNIAVTGSGTIKLLALPSQTAHGDLTALLFTSCSNVAVRGLSFNANGLASGMVAFYSCSNYLAEENYLYGGIQTSPAGIMSFLGTDGQITDNWITAFNLGVHVGEGGGTPPVQVYDTNVTVSRNHIWATYCDGIAVKAYGATITDNTIHDLTTASNLGVGIDIMTYPGFPGTGYIVKGNSMYNCKQSGIEGGGAYDYVALGWANDTAINGLIIEGNTISATGGNGMLLGNIHGGVIKGNIIENTNGSIEIFSYGTGATPGMDQTHDVLIVGNIITDTRTGSARGYNAIGLLLSNNPNTDCMTGIVVSQNIINNMATEGIDFSRTSTGTASHFRVDGNLIQGTGDTGLLLYDGFEDMDILGNTFIGSTNYDLYLNILNAHAVRMIGNRYTTLNIAGPGLPDLFGNFTTNFSTGIFN